MDSNQKYVPLQVCGECHNNIATKSGLCIDCEPNGVAKAFGRKQLATKPAPKVSVKPPVVETEASVEMTEAEPTIVITQGLGGSDRNCQNVPLSEVEDYLKTHKECYERTAPNDRNTNPLNRLYIDLDGKLPLETEETAFNSKHTEILKVLREYAERKGWSLMEASKWRCSDDKGNQTNVISYRLTDPHKCGSKADIKSIVVNEIYPKLQRKLRDIIPVKALEHGQKKDGETTLYIDLGVYNNGNRKMRMWNQTKPLQKRPNKLVLGELVDTLITYIPDGCQRLPQPVNILTIKPETMVEEIKAIESEVLAECNETNSVITATETTDPTSDDVNNRELMIEVIKGLGKGRWDYYPDWIRIGFVCYNEGLTLEDFIEFSKVSKHWQTGSPKWITAKWKNFRKSNLTQALLWRWLSEDNMDLYNELSERRMDFWKLLKCANNAETARFFYNLKPDAYAFNEKLGWYQLLPSNLWKWYEKVPSGLVSDIWRSFKPIIKEHQNRINLTEADEDKAKIEKGKLTALMKFAHSIGSHSFISGVIQFLPSCYNDDELDKKMDESRHLVAFSDSVYDLDKSEVREIKPDDWCSINTGYPFPRKRFSDAREELLEVIRSCFETSEQMENPEMGDMAMYLLKTIASCLHGRKKWEQFYVWTGSGGNGKSMISDMVKRALGDYYHSIPNSCITKPSDKKDAPNPPIAKAKGKRFVQASEPEADDKLQVGMIKEYSGGDDITARDMYRSTITYKPQFSLFLQTNNIPQLNRPDGGIQRRLRVITFPFQFVANPTEDWHKLGNPDIKDTIIKSPEWRDEMFHLLLECYEDIKRNGLKEPKAIAERTQEYMDENNPVQSWLNQKYEKVGAELMDDRKYYIGAESLWLKFKEEKNMKIGADAFKTMMILSGFTQVKESHPFKTTRKNGFGTEEVIKPAGKYWKGLVRKSDDGDD